MAGTVLTYSPSDVRMNISGYDLGGLLNISIEWNAQQMQIRRGIRGQNTRIRNSDLSCRVSVDVLQTSVTNDVLFEIFLIDRRRQFARLDLTISDNSGRTVFQTAEAYVTMVPTVTYSMGFDARRWVFEVLSVTDGRLSGSADQGIDLFSGTGTNILDGLAGIGTSISNIL